MCSLHDAVAVAVQLEGLYCKLYCNCSTVQLQNRKAAASATGFPTGFVIAVNSQALVEVCAAASVITKTKAFLNQKRVGEHKGMAKRYKIKIKSAFKY